MKKSLLKNGLFVRRPVSNAILRLWNWFFFWKRKGGEIPLAPKKILLCNLANLGDVVISTAVLPAIRSRYPDCKIGFLTSSKGAVVLRDHPLISRVYVFDHLYLHRQGGICKAVLQHVRGKRRVKRELREEKYDLAIDLYSYFPNAIPLLAESQIPVRIGYPTGGFSNLLTHSMDWDFAGQYVGYAHLHLLRALRIEATDPLPSYGFQREGSGKIVVHMGSLNPLKEWKVERWVSLILRLEAKGYKVVLTGQGEREGRQCQLVARETSSQDRSNQLSWSQFVEEIQGARLLLSVDSAAIHVAAGAKVPILALFTKSNPIEMWLPPSPFSRGVGIDSDVETMYEQAMELVCKK